MGQSTTNNSLWCGRAIPILGLSGHHSAGKTYFAASIAPNDTLYLDLEGSALDYRDMGFEHFDVRMVTAKRLDHLPEPLDVYKSFADRIFQIKHGEYKVIVVDPISGTLEMGMVDFVATQYAKHGFKTRSAFEAKGGLFWSKVKSYWEEVLFFLTARCETFVFITHLRGVWKDNRPTGEMETSGKTTLRQLASLYLVLERRAKRRGVAPPLVPSAIVDKVRTLSAFPPRLPEATPDSIRHYIEHPADYTKLTEDEIALEQELTDDEKLRITAGAEEHRREAAALELETAKTQQKTIEAREIAKRRAKEKK